MPETDNLTKARLWAMEFADKVETVETFYHAWHVAIDIARKSKSADESVRKVLYDGANMKQQRYNTARAELYAWVVSHPAPEGADQLT